MLSSGEATDSRRVLMKIDLNLATAIARAAISAPYRQVDALPTDEFTRWLEARGISVGDWSLLHHLWAIGVLHPVVVLEHAREATPLFANSEERLVKVELGLPSCSFVDLGINVPNDAQIMAPHPYPYTLQKALLWHPFQLWLFDNLDRWVIRPNAKWTHYVHDPSTESDVSWTWRWRRDLVLEFASSDQHHSFLRILSLLLQVEPAVHPLVNPVTRLPGPGTEVDYFDWRESQPFAEALAASGLDVDEAVKWHELLSFSAKVVDPVKHFRKLFRHADRDQRKRLKGAALLAHDLWDQAEVLRRYLERYHGCELLEEDDVGHSPDISRVNENLYGSARPGDFDRRAFRRIARRFGVDPQARTVYFVEGETEVAFVRRWAELLGLDLDAASVQVINLSSKNNLRSPLMTELVRRLHEDEIFAVIAVDEDKHSRGRSGVDHVTRLRELWAAKALAIRPCVWRPNFVARNFTPGELVSIAKAEADRHGLCLHLTAKEVAAALRSYNAAATNPQAIRTIEDALFALANQRSQRRLLGKGTEWGKLLADWAVRVAPPKAVQDRDGQRPILALCGLLMRGRYSDYALTHELSRRRRR
jgi:hypothetical protein